MQLQVQAISAT